MIAVIALNFGKKIKMNGNMHHVREIWDCSNHFKFWQKDEKLFRIIQTNTY
jgi:hypothetical protein